MSKLTRSITGKLFNYFNQRLNTKRSTHGYYRCDCPYCGGKFTFGINVEVNKAHCFKCEEKPGTFGLLMYLENFETFNEVRNFLNIQQDYDLYTPEVKRKNIEPRKIELPQGYNSIVLGSSVYARAARSYMKRRGFDIEKLATKGVGYCDEGLYAGYIIFPFYTRGELVFWQGRKYLSNGPKMANPPEDQIGMGKSQIIYNADAMYIYQTIYLVESITNAETIGDNAIATLGKDVSPYQLNMMLAAPFENIVILLDKDATNKAIELSMKLVNYKRVKLVRMPTDDDVNKIGRKATLNLVKSESYKKYMDFYKLKLNGNSNTINTYNRAGFGFGNKGSV
jgi:hypothetical protein